MLVFTNLVSRQNNLQAFLSSENPRQIGSSAAETVFELLCNSDKTAETVANEEGLMQVNDEASLATWVNEAIEAQPQAAEDVRVGKDAAIGRLIGDVMKRSGGSADAGAVRKQIIQTLRS